jgi:hypothetical protein
MPEPSDTQPVEARKSSGRRRRRRLGVLRRIWTEWRVEVLVAVLVAVAVFLLVERMQIRVTLLRWLGIGTETIGESLTAIFNTIAAFITRTTVSDLLGYALLLVAVSVVFLRVRWRVRHNPRFTELRCPTCGSELSRIHRRVSDRVVNLFAPVRRYRCRNRDCYWQGRRYRRPGS